MAARTYVRASGRSRCEDILLKILKLCLQNDPEAKININLYKLRSIMEVIDEGILVPFDGKKTSSEDKSEKKKAQGAILNSFKGKRVTDFRHKNDNVQVRDKKLSWAEAFAKDKVMHMGLSQMEARTVGVKLHQKLTSIISIALNKGA